jgi:hypothetical protein
MRLPMAARQAVDLGPAPGDTPLTDLTLRFSIAQQQQAVLTQWLADQQNPASPRYHHWLTPEQFGEQFGLDQPDLDKIAAWLTAQGFTVTQVARGRLFLRFSGTVAQADAAFHVQLHRLSLDGQEHVAALTSPQMPANMAALLTAITGLNDFHWSPPHPISPATIPPALAAPQYTYGSGINIYHTLTPADFYTIYDENPLLAEGIDGSGVAIAIMGQSDLDPDGTDDITAFRTASGLPPANLTQVLYGQDPGVSELDEAESLLDLEWSGAAAPGAQLILVRGPDSFYDALTGAIDNDIAPILSTSYAACEAPDEASLAISNSFYPLFLMANAQGQTIIAASGDQGSTACDDDTPATLGLAVNFPASLPSVTGVGGTQFPGDGGPFSGDSSSYWSTLNGPTGGSALSYVPEQAWNGGNGVGSTGGVSLYYTKPSWQTGEGVPTDFSRDVPDISLDANSYEVCTVSSCVDGFLDASGNLTEGGAGTSFGAPAFAGLLALVEQKNGSAIGNANPTLYALANSTYYASTFHDVTVGSNAVLCAVGSIDCPASGIMGYAAGPGYDLATGWGSVDATNLANNWSLVTPSTSTAGQTLSTTTLSSSAATVSQGTAIHLTAMIAPASSATTPSPTGNVQFLLDNVAVGAAVPLTSGAAAYQLDTTNLREAHTVQAAYSGDATYAGSKDSFPITVNATTAAAASVITLNSAQYSFAQGTTATFTANVAPGLNSNTTTPTGGVQFFIDNGSLGPPVLLRNGVATLTYFTGEFIGVGSHTLSATYSGDTNFATSQTSAGVAITAGVPDFTLLFPTTTFTVTSGSATTQTFDVLSQYGFAGSVQITTNYPNATITPNPVPVIAGHDTVTGLTINAYTEASLHKPAAPWWPRSIAGIALALLFLPILPRKRRTAALLTVLLACTMLNLSSCGGAAASTISSGGGSGSGGGSNPPPPPVITNTPPGIYPIILTATATSGSTTITHQTMLTFVVQ